MAKKRKSDQAERAVIYMLSGRISHHLRERLLLEKTPYEICTRAVELMTSFEEGGLLDALRAMWTRLRKGYGMDVVWGGPEWDIFREPHRDAC